MMSPISVARYLAPGALEFDVVIFDEASQVEPADAYGAIARGRQVVLVGDEKQLPPTNFFSRIEVGEGTPDDGEAFASGDLESILALGVVRLPERNRCSLRWHYRSRHESLIEFSNARFYDGALRVFPSATRDRGAAGLSFRKVDDAIYMRAAGQNNPVEARAVAEAVAAHAIESPHLSLGVGAFSQAHQRAVQDEVELLRRTSADDRLERFFASHPTEPFFVKNLETIQGDERDVILLSLGYGADAEGRLTLNFGPLNRDGGWRRLNVLVTRARERCVLFSSIRADQLRIEGTRARGVVALRDYLHYAEHGRLDGAMPAGGRDSPLEAGIAAALRERGWEVHARVGAAGFAVDLAVVDPDRPGRYLLGIECDGATYHASATARDRDRLRQSVLEERLGWHIERVWSPEWFERPDVALGRLLARLGQLREEGARPAPPPSAEMPASESETVQRPLFEASSGLVDGVVPYRVAPSLRLGDQHALLASRAELLASAVATIVESEWPIHEDDAARRLVSMYGTRLSPRSRSAFTRALEYAVELGLVSRRGQFLWRRGETRPPVRFRGDGCPVRDPSSIAPEELEAAVTLAVGRGYGLRSDALVAAVAKMLGFGRRGAALAAAVDSAARALVDRGEIDVDAHGMYVLTRPSSE